MLKWHSIFSLKSNRVLLDNGEELMESNQFLGEVTLLSDDCWAGEFYRKADVRYATPTVGLWVGAKFYLKYLAKFDKVHQNKMTFIETDKHYPTAIINGVRLGFMHATNEKDAEECYWRRFRRINPSRTFTKIDFGKPGYTDKHIKNWNQLRIPNSVALYPESMKIPSAGIFNGIPISNWTLDGAKLFHISIQQFNFDEWICTGKLKRQ